MTEHLKNIAFIGASGNLGSKTLDALLKEDKHSITVITRSSSTVDYDSRVHVHKGEYQDAAFLESALQDQDVLVIMLGFAGLGDQDAMIQAAAKAGVKYILPTTYGGAIGDDRHVKAIPLFQEKRDVHDRIEALGMEWIGVVTNSWTDYVSQEKL